MYLMVNNTNDNNTQKEITQYSTEKTLIGVLLYRWKLLSRDCSKPTEPVYPVLFLYFGFTYLVFF